MEELKNGIKTRLSFVDKFALFIRTQGVVGLAVAVILGGAVQKVVTALVNDIINPLVGLMLGRASNLKEASFNIGDAVILWGDFVSTIIDFLVIAFIIYLLVRVLRMDALDKKKE